MKFALLVLGSPYAGQSAESAWQYARAVVDQGHELYRVFFYHEAVSQGNALSVPHQEEVNHAGRWAQLASESGTEWVLCVASALKRGILDDREAQRHERDSSSAHPGFIISGLGQLIDAHAHCDRLVTFGP